MKKYQLILLSLLSGLLLSLAWPAHGFSPLLLIALVPLLYIEDYIIKHKETFTRYACFFYAYPAFFLWNLLTTWWIYYATDVGMILAIILNAFMMAVVFNLFHVTRSLLLCKKHGYIALLTYWMAFEYIHLNWELTWSWLNLGNGFANTVKWIQWYEYTGTFGGTFWILLVNILVLFFLQALLNKSNSVRMKIIPGLSVLLTLLVPIFISYVIYFSYEERKDPVDIVIVQPNIDPYLEQYITPPPLIVNRLLDLARAETDKNVDFIVCPESALQEYMWHDLIESYQSTDSLRKFLDHYPNVSVIVGLSSRDFLPVGASPTRAAREYFKTGRLYEEYNTSMMMDTSDKIQLYHKSKLVVGVENMPFTHLVKPIEKLAINLGGTVGTIGICKERTVFRRERDSLKVAALICFESIFGEFCAKFVRNGAGLLFIITNDGWWKNTPGHRQHMSYGRLRTIETRRSIARSANTGISAYINQRGDVLQSTEYWTPDVIRDKLNSNSKITFYVRYGDYLARIATFTGILLLLISISLKIMKRRIGIA